MDAVNFDETAPPELLGEPVLTLHQTLDGFAISYLQGVEVIETVAEFPSLVGAARAYRAAMVASQGFGGAK